MKTIVNKITSVVFLVLLILADHFSAAELSTSTISCKAGLMQGTLPLWLGMLVVLGLAMYAKVALAEE